VSRLSNKYIGFKMIQAERATRMNLSKTVYPHSRPMPDMVKNNSEEGYQVTYPDGYISFSPKDVFEKAYMQVGDNNTITQELVDNFIKDYDVFTKQGKITVVIATLKNGFTIVESSACVDPKNYNEEMGSGICKARINNQVWNHLGFLLQTAKDGII